MKATSAGLTASIAAWILAIFLAIAFTLAGGSKLASSPGMVKEFAEIGIGQWLRYVTGVLEVVSGVGVLIPRFRSWAAVVLATVMLGATATNLIVLHVATWKLTAVLLFLALTLAWLRRRDRLAV